MQRLVGVGSQMYLVSIPEPKLDFIGTICWEQPIWVYAYPADRFCEYDTGDLSWAKWCGIGRRLRVLYDNSRESRPILPEGWVLPHGWYYKCEGYGDPTNIRTNLNYYGMPPRRSVMYVTGV